jgi:hypothetical protein
LNEQWLQDRIADDPSILGLGDLEIAGKEHRQPLGGRIDFLLRSTEEDTYFEVEVMLGSLDESHIIRTIEYWDVERQRRPASDHRAVIVAEGITARFFNVLRLLNRAVPLIAIQLSAFRIDDKVYLHPVTVLNVTEEVADLDETDVIEKVDRLYWERKAKPEFLSIVDRVVGFLRNSGREPTLTYNRRQIVLGTTGYNFCWFSPRVATLCRVRIRLRGSSEIRDQAVSSLVNSGVDASPIRTEMLVFGVSAASLQQHQEAIEGVLTKAEAASRDENV